MHWKRVTCRWWIVGCLMLAPLFVAADEPESPPSGEAKRTDSLWESLAPHFRPPAEFADDLGEYRSPLIFDNGTPVKTAEDWQHRRRELLETWHGLMGPWPELIERPATEYLEETRRESFTQHRIRVAVAPDMSSRDSYLLIPDGEGPFPAVLVVYYDAETGAGLGKELRDFGYQLTRRGFVTLSIGTPPRTHYPSKDDVRMQPLSLLAYVAANCANALASLPNVDPERIGVVGHSYGGKWAMFASCLSEKFACAAWSDGGIVFDERRGNVNFWEPWYLGYDPDQQRKPGIPSAEKPRTGSYRKMIETGRDLHELHALMAPRPFLVSGGSEDPPHRWQALNHAIAVNRLLGFENRVAMTNRRGHSPTAESNEQIYTFFQYFLQREKP